MCDARHAAMLRTFLATDGTRWTVWCVEPSALVAQPGVQPAWLVFTDERGMECQRLFEFPPDWATMPSERLDLLRRIAEPAPSRGSLPLPVEAGDGSGRAAERTPSSRTFVDRDGVVWRVWEVRPSLLDRRRMRERRALPRPRVERRRSNAPRPVVAVREDLRDGWLAFQSAAEHRRRAPIPDGWSEMKDEELRELLANAMRFERVHGTG